jgi:hypothetical protein
MQVANISRAKYEEISGREPETDRYLHLCSRKIVLIHAAQDAKCESRAIKLDNQIVQLPSQ